MYVPDWRCSSMQNYLNQHWWSLESPYYLLCILLRKITPQSISLIEYIDKTFAIWYSNIEFVFKTHQYVINVLIVLWWSVLIEKHIFDNNSVKCELSILDNSHKTIYWNQKHKRPRIQSSNSDFFSTHLWLWVYHAEQQYKWCSFTLICVLV